MPHSMVPNGKKLYNSKKKALKGFLYQIKHFYKREVRTFYYQITRFSGHDYYQLYEVVID